MKDTINKTMKLENIRIKAVGDICPGDKSILGLGICSLSKKLGTDFIFDKVNQHLNNVDILIGNLEGLITQKMLTLSSPNLTFCGLPSFAQTLKKNGFNVINVANNHILEHGTEIFLETIEYLKEQGIHICGLRDNDEFYSKPVIINKDNTKIGILSYNWVGKDKFPEADQYIAQSHDSIVNYTWHRNHLSNEEIKSDTSQWNKNVIKDISKLKKAVDFVILYPHWGFEFVSYPPFGVTREARSFIDAGADLIIGSHPHVIQGYEIYKNKYIFYSLGNFIFDMRFNNTRNALILDYTVDHKEKDNFSFTFVRSNKYFQPEKVNGKTKLKIQNIIQHSNDNISSQDKNYILNDDKVYREFEIFYNKSKFLTILHHFWAIFSYPKVLIIISRKIFSFLGLLLKRFRGQKIRW